MAIRFQCGACSQPIEVDDEWASRTVACPYCRKTITAPAESTLGDISQIPTAAPLSAPHGGGPAPPTFYPWTIPVADHPNRLALVAFALAFGVLALLVAVSVTTASHRLELEAFQERIGALQGEGRGLMAAAQRASAELYDKYGGRPPTWMMVGGLLEFSALLAWVAALVCGIIAVRRPRRRSWAVASLVTTGLVPVLVCLGIVLGGAV